MQTKKTASTNLLFMSLLIITLAVPALTEAGKNHHRHGHPHHHYDRYDHAYGHSHHHHKYKRHYRKRSSYYGGYSQGYNHATNIDPTIIIRHLHPSMGIPAM